MLVDVGFVKGSKLGEYLEFDDCGGCDPFLLRPVMSLENSINTNGNNTNDNNNNNNNNHNPTTNSTTNKPHLPQHHQQIWL